ncbi:MAG: hypothetical protein EZS28_050151, partial [Streblomastix strix]
GPRGPPLRNPAETRSFSNAKQKAQQSQKQKSSSNSNADINQTTAEQQDDQSQVEQFERAEQLNRGGKKKAQAEVSEVIDEEEII